MRKKRKREEKEEEIERDLETNCFKRETSV
jgi:hypothetical protein